MDGSYFFTGIIYSYYFVYFYYLTPFSNVTLIYLGFGTRNPLCLGFPFGLTDDYYYNGYSS